MSAIQTNRQTLLNAVSATTTSAPVPVNNAGRLSIQVFGSSVTSGNGVFTFEVSNDNTNWVSYNRLTSNVTNTNAQQDTRIASVTINTNAGSMLFIPPGDTFNFIRTTVTRTTDGNFSAIAYVD